MADAKLSSLTAETAPVSTDITYIVDDPGGTPASKQVTLANFGKGITDLPNMTGSVGATGGRATAGWFTDLTVTNKIAGNITGNCDGNCGGQAATVATIAGLAPNTATTQATQPNITTCANLTTIGTVTSGGLGTGAVIAKPTMTLGSDADGDTYYRASNVLSRVAKGTAGQVYTMNTGATAPEWAAAGGTVAKSFKIFDDAALLSTSGVGDGKMRWTVPIEYNALNIKTVGLHVYTVSSSGLPQVAIYNETDACDILSTNLTIDANETDSMTAAVPAVIDTTHDDLATGDVLRFDLDAVGTGTKGLELRIGIGA